jgi:hypothetical protein
VIDQIIKEIVARIKGVKVCERCDDQGWYYVMNGPDDVDQEPCDCAIAEELIMR